MKRRVWLCVLIFPLVIYAAALAAQSPRPAKVSIATTLDRTAIWVGDSFHYTVQVLHDRELEFVLENLQRESLRLAPFTVRDITFRADDWVGNKRLLEIVFELAAYESGASELTIPSFQLYYFPKRSRIEQKETHAEAVQVPAARIGLRSTLGSGSMQLRDSQYVDTVDGWRWIAPLLLGITGTLYVAGYGTMRAWARFRVARPAKRRLRGHVMNQWVQDRLSRIRSRSADSPQELSIFYGDLADFLRAYLAQRLGIETAGLTPEEVERALTEAGTNGAISAQVKSVLEQCETVLYRKDGSRLGAELKTSVLEAVEKIVKTPVM